MNFFQKAYYKTDKFVQEHSVAFTERILLPFLQVFGLLLVAAGFMMTVSDCRMTDSSFDRAGKRIHEALYNETNKVPFEIANFVSNEFREVRRSAGLGTLMGFIPPVMTLSGFALFIFARKQKVRKPIPPLYPRDPE